MAKLPRELSIGAAARRSGLTVSQIRFYEARGLIAPPRNHAGRRRFPRAELRRLAFIRAAQRLGLPLSRIGEALSALPSGQAPTARDWAAVATDIRAELDRRIDGLTRLRDELDGCIGCGCLSMEACRLLNPEDRLGADGPGPRRVMEGASRR